MSIVERLKNLENYNEKLTKLLSLLIGDDMFALELRMLRDPRLMSAILEAEKQMSAAGSQPVNFLNIISMILGNLPLILENLNNPTALVGVVLQLLGFTPPPASQPPSH